MDKLQRVMGAVGYTSRIVNTGLDFPSYPRVAELISKDGVVVWAIFFDVSTGNLHTERNNEHVNDWDMKHIVLPWNHRIMDTVIKREEPS